MSLGINDSMFGISTRKDGWLVRLKFLNGIPKYQRFFPLSKNPKNSLKKAKRYRDRIARKIKSEIGLSFPSERSIPQKNNTTGYLGVIYSKQEVDESGKIKNYASYKAAFLDENGKWTIASFSANKYGEEEALYLAVHSRRLRRRINLTELNHIHEEK